MIDTLREDALRAAYWQHREQALGMWHDEPNARPCQNGCFADITARWVEIVTKRAGLAPAAAEAPVDYLGPAQTSGVLPRRLQLSPEAIARSLDGPHPVDVLPDPAAAEPAEEALTPEQFWREVGEWAIEQGYWDRAAHPAPEAKRDE